MLYPINGLKDIHTVLVNERKLGGTVELEQLKLRSGATYNNAVIVHIDYVGQRFYHATIVTEAGEKIVIHVDNIELMKNPVHKNVCDLNNTFVRTFKLKERIAYLERLLELNEGNKSKVYLAELKQLVKDIGEDIVRQNVKLSSVLNEGIRPFRIA